MRPYFLSLFFALYLLIPHPCTSAGIPEISLDVTATSYDTSKVNKAIGATSNLGKSLSLNDNLGFIIGSSSVSGTKKAFVAPSKYSTAGILNLDSAPLSFKTSSTDSLFGLTVASGNIIGTNTPDYIIGDPSFDGNRGIVYIIDGDTTIGASTISLNPLTAQLTIKGEMINDFFGYSVSIVGDINHDPNSFNDVLIGAPFKNGNQGAVYVIYGAASMTSKDLASAPLTNSAGFKITGEAVLSYFGYSVGSAGDFNADGIQDFIIGAYGLNSNQGAAYVIYGNTALYGFDLSQSPIASSRGLRITGASLGDNFGWSVSYAGDVNSDNKDDIIIGAPKANSGSGAAYIFTGQNGLPAQIYADSGFEITTSLPGSLLGFSVAKAGNVNADGFPDVIIGAPGENSLQGAAYVIYGKSTLTPITVDTLTYDQGFQISTTDLNGQLGYSVASVGRFNSNQFYCVIASAPYATSTSAGAAFIVFGFKQCSSKCAQCDSYGMCLNCKPQYAMLANNICGYCPTGKYILAGLCADCSNGCEYCLDATSCNQCDNTHYLYQQQCYITCPARTYPDLFNKCISCPTECSDSCTSSGDCPPPTMTLPITESQIKQANVSAAVFDSASLVANTLVIGSSLPTNFGLVAKIIRNIRYLNVTVSPELQVTFYVWKTQSKFLAAPSSWDQKFDHKALPIVFERYGLSSVFLVNYWRSLIMILIGLTVFGIFKLLESQAQKQTMLHTITKTVNVAASNFALTQIYSSLDDIFFFFILEAQAIIFDSSLNGLSFGLGIILLIFAIFVLGAHIMILLKYQRLKKLEVPAETQNYFKKYLNTYPNIKMIYADFKDLNFFQQNFLLVHVIRCIISNIIITAFHTYPLLQTLLLLSTSIAIIAYLVLKKPFKSLIKTCGQFFCEIILFFVHFFMLIMAIMNEAESQNVSAFKVLSKFIIVFNLILLLGSVVFMIIELFFTFFTIYKEKTATPSKTPIALPITLHPRKMEEDPTRPFPKQNYPQEEYPTNIPSYPFRQDYQHLDTSQNQIYMNDTIIPPQHMYQDQPYYEENSNATHFYPSPEKNLLDSGLNNSGFSEFQPNFSLDNSSPSPNISHNSRNYNSSNNNNPLDKRHNKRLVRKGTQQRSPQITFEPEMNNQARLQEKASSFQQKSSISSGTSENIIKRTETNKSAEKRNEVVFEELEEPTTLNWQSETKTKPVKAQNQTEEKPKGAYDHFLQRMQDDLQGYGNQGETEGNNKEKKRVIAFWNS